MNAKEFIKKLIDSGYREFDDKLNNSNRSFQKRFKDGSDTKYFIMVYYYKAVINDTIHESFEFDLQFEKIINGKQVTMNVTIFSVSDWDEEKNIPIFYDPKLIEDYIEEFFNINKFEYYERY